jgi:hypothetical protein
MQARDTGDAHRHVVEFAQAQRHHFVGLDGTKDVGLGRPPTGVDLPQAVDDPKPGRLAVDLGRRDVGLQQVFVVGELLAGLGHLFGRGGLDNHPLAAAAVGRLDGKDRAQRAQVQIGGQFRLLGEGRQNDAVRRVQAVSDQLQMHGRLVGRVGFPLVGVDAKDAVGACPIDDLEEGRVGVGGPVDMNARKFSSAIQQRLIGCVQVFRRDPHHRDALPLAFLLQDVHEIGVIGPVPGDTQIESGHGAALYRRPAAATSSSVRGSISRGASTRR